MLSKRSTPPEFNQREPHGNCPRGPCIRSTYLIFREFLAIRTYVLLDDQRLPVLFCERLDFLKHLLKVFHFTIIIVRDGVLALPFFYIGTETPIVSDDTTASKIIFSSLSSLSAIPTECVRLL